MTLINELWNRNHRRLEPKLTEVKPSASDDGYIASLACGAHRPDPDNPTQGFHAPFLGEG